MTIVIEMQMYEKFSFKPLKNKFLPKRKVEMGSDMGKSGLLWFASFFPLFQIYPHKSIIIF